MGVLLFCFSEYLWRKRICSPDHTLFFDSSFLTTHPIFRPSCPPALLHTPQLAVHRRLPPALELRVQNVMYFMWSSQLGHAEADIAERLPPHLLVEMRCAQV